MKSARTTTEIQSRRRDLLKAFAGAPLLPLTLTVSGLLPAYATASRRKGFTAATFSHMPAPSLENPAAMAVTTVQSHLEVIFDDGTRQSYALAYQPFFMTGDMVPDGKGGRILAGGCYDINNRPIIDRSLPGKERHFFSNCPDGSSLLTLNGVQVAGVKGNTVFAVVQFENTTRDQQQADMERCLPSPIAVLTLDQDPQTGQLTLVKYHNVDTSPVNGLWVTCGASLSPWNTHLSSEEYEPDAAAIADDARFQAFSRNLFGDAAKANPYHYGHLPEITVHADGSGSVVKHYCLGRISHELVQVMPDRRTVLMGDDATNGGLFMFIADREADLSAGTLYVARWFQISDVGPGAGTLKWIRLGHATSAQIKALADQLKASDIMDIKTSDPQDMSYTKIPFDGKTNWIRLHPGMEQAAVFLETHRYAALMGGSLGFTKMEGTTVNAKDKIAYLAMSYVQTSMLDGSGGIEVQGPKAGAIYALNMQGGQRDLSGAVIDSAWVPVDMVPPAALIGEDLKQPDALGNLANAERIANPDNIKFSEKLRTLFIGEDSDMHVNNFLWAYHIDSGRLSRILSCPAGAESTGLHAVDEINGWTYIMSNFQHAGAWEKPLHDKVRERLDPLVRANYRDRFGAMVAYLTGVQLPA
jgi:secreted PhoX family phosphatase